MPTSSYALAFAAALLAGAINSVAGGGTLITFSTLVFLGLDPKAANATNTVALWPASVAGALGFRREHAASRSLLRGFAAVSVAGAVCGALLLKYTPPGEFKAIVPWLILLAAVLFLTQEMILRRVGPAADEPPAPRGLATPLIFQFCVGLYGGYFGAGIGILMLAVLSVMRAGDIYQMNFLKNTGALLINGVAALLFILWGMVAWPTALAMAAGATLGGYSGAGIARKIGARALRTTVSIIGLLIAGCMLFQQLR